MGNLTKNLSRHEFACRCGCGEDTADFELVNALQDGCDHFSKKFGREVGVKITGPNRCRMRNKTEEGANNSQHIHFKAADHFYYFKDSGDKLNCEMVALYYEAKYEGKWGIGRYNGRTHLDTRTNGPARWDGR